MKKNLSHTHTHHVQHSTDSAIKSGRLEYEKLAIQAAAETRQKWKETEGSLSLTLSLPPPPFSLSSLSLSFLFPPSLSPSPFPYCQFPHINKILIVLYNSGVFLIPQFLSFVQHLWLLTKKKELLCNDNIQLARVYF